jgi:hypothetical protein
VHGVVDRLIDRQPCDLQGLLRPEAVEFQPAVFPGNAVVCDIGRDLAG